ncbi:hypothetical protein GpartN1_g6953.t1 [Galdieria partita]|uniref:U3 small nucleolar ribonucleoprotein protein MPP10 n=1 Tax=Galdieria partita TaxID=83374 RepID=A0A9C7Q4W6_9RHOD|nr:hypothetical protein GpartN1_g6953.t1 [Galdieria partita]
MTEAPWTTDNLPSEIDIVERKPETIECWKVWLKTLFDRQTKKPYGFQLLGPLAQLYVQGFQVEQIWEQLQLRNRPLLRFVTKKLQQWEVQFKESGKQNEQTYNQNLKEETEDNMDAVKDDHLSDEQTQEMEETREKNETQLANQEYGNINEEQEDKFFSYEELAKVADREELYEETNNVQDDDEDLWQEELYNNESGGETEEQEYHYEEFFDQSNVQNTTNSNKNNNSVDPTDEKIKQLEEKYIGNKHWSMLGEVRASQRPVNSALDIELDFDSAMRQRKVDKSDEEVGAVSTLEERIKRRIVESAYDDVIRAKPTETSRPTVVELTQDKDRRGLSELYEEQFLLQTQGSQSKQQDKRHDEIEELFKELTTKLDALSNFHYTPHPAPPELKVIPSNLPSIVAEEAVPEVLGDGDLLAPEQIYKPVSNQENKTKDASQITSEDRKRWRRKRKRAGKRAKLRKEWEAKIAHQQHKISSTKQQRKDAMKTLETLKHTSRGIKIDRKANTHKEEDHQRETKRRVGQKVHSSSLKL